MNESKGEDEGTMSGLNMRVLLRNLAAAMIEDEIAKNTNEGEVQDEKLMTVAYAILQVDDMKTKNEEAVAEDKAKPYSVEDFQVILDQING